MTNHIIEEMLSMRNENQAQHLMKFFKTAKGQYGYGDLFLGIKVPITRNIVKKYRNNIDLNGIDVLLQSQWHEIRLTGFLLLIELFNTYTKKKKLKTAEEIVLFYLDHISYGNNWDLVDLVAPKILGIWIVAFPEKAEILYELSDRMDNLWHQRVAIVSTWSEIRSDRFDITLRLAEKYLTHPHDLIHKATGWMLREVGKREKGLPLLRAFLDKYASQMPRTMLRYSIEKLDNDERQKYLSQRK